MTVVPGGMIALSMSVMRLVTMTRTGREVVG
jgi:hypothetical protein